MVECYDTYLQWAYDACRCLSLYLCLSVCVVREWALKYFFNTHMIMHWLIVNLKSSDWCNPGWYIHTMLLSISFLFCSFPCLSHSFALFLSFAVLAASLSLSPNSLFAHYVYITKLLAIWREVTIFMYNIFTTFAIWESSERAFYLQNLCIWYKVLKSTSLLLLTKSNRNVTIVVKIVTIAPTIQL